MDSITISIWRDYINTELTSEIKKKVLKFYHLLSSKMKLRCHDEINKFGLYVHFVLISLI